MNLSKRKRRSFFIIFILLSIVGNFSCSEGRIRSYRPRLSVDDTLDSVMPSFYRGEVRTLPEQYDSFYSGQFRVIQAGPQGALTGFSGSQFFYIVFSRPVVDSNEVGKRVKRLSSVKISPPVKGEYSWAGENVLIFEPDEGLFLDGEYTVSVAGKIRSDQGIALGEDFSFRFVPRLFEIRDFWCGSTHSILNSSKRKRDNVSLKALKRIYLETLYPIPAKQLRSLLEIRDGVDSLNYKIDLIRTNPEGRGRAVYRIKLKEKVAEGDLLQLFFDDLPLDGRSLRIEETFTLQRVYRDHDYRRLLLFPEKPNVLYLNLDFTSEPDLNTLQGKVFVNGEAVTPLLLTPRGRRILYTGPLRPVGEQNELVILPGVRDLNKRKIETQLMFHFEVETESDYLYSPYRPFNYLPSDDPGLALELSGVDGGEWLLSPVTTTGEPTKAAPLRLPFKPDGSRYPHVAEIDPSAVFAGLGEQGLFQGRIQVPGSQGISLSAGAGEGYLFQVTSLALTTAASPDELTVAVVELRTGEPVPGAAVELKLPSGVKQSSVSDVEGIARFKREEMGRDFRREQLSLTAVKGDRRIDYTVMPQSVIVSGEQESPVRRAYLEVEKSTYTPGEKAFLSIIDLVPESGRLRPARGGFSLSLKRLQPYPRNYRPVRGELHPAGLIRTGYTLPAELPSGQYLFSYSGPGSYGEVRIEVQGSDGGCRLEPDRKQYVAGDRIQVEIRSENTRGEASVNSETVLTMNRHFVPFPEEFLPWPEGYAGPLSGEGAGEALNRTLYSDNNGNSYFILDSLELYRGEPRLPCRLEMSPRVMLRNRMIGGPGKVAELFPSTYMLAARITGGDWAPAVRRGRKFHVEFEAVKPDGRELPLSDLNADIIVEIQSVDSSGEPLEIVRRYRETVRTGKGRIPFRIKEAGRYRVTLRSRDRLGNPVITELPLYILGEDSASTRVQIQPLNRRFSSDEPALLWVNLPQAAGMRRGSRLMVIKEKEGIEEVLMMDSFRGSQVISVSLNPSDVPGVRLHLAAWDGADSPRPGQSDDDYSCRTMLASSRIKVRSATGDMPHLSFSGLETGEAGEVRELAALAVGNSDSESGRLVTFFIPEKGGSGEPVPGVEQFFLNRPFSPGEITFSDTRSLVPNGLLNLEAVETPPAGGEKAMLYERDHRFSYPLMLHSGKEAQFTLQYPAVPGQYHLVVSGVWNGSPFSRLYPVSVSGDPTARMELPKQLSERDFCLGRIGLLPHTVPQGTTPARVHFRVTDLDTAGDTQGISLSPSKLVLSSLEGWNSQFAINAVTAGRYRIEMEMRCGESVQVEAHEIEVLPSGGEVSALFQADSEERIEPDEFPIRLPTGDETEVSIELAGGSRLSMAYSRLVRTLTGNSGEDFLDGELSAMFPQIVSGRSARIYDPSYNMSSGSVNRELERLSRLQQANGGFPLYLDRNFESDYYTTVRIADVLQRSGVNYYNYARIWPLTQFLKLAFKGEASNKQSHYLLCYSALILARFEENIILNAKNLLEADQGSIAELSLAGMAVLTAGRNHNADVSSYLEEPLLRILRRFDPDLLADQLEAPDGSGGAHWKLVAPEGSALEFGRHGYERPGKRVVEAALAFLFLDQLGGHDRESRQAAVELVEGDLSGLNLLDASFCLRALRAAERRGFLNDYKLPDGGQGGSAALSYQDVGVASVEWSGEGVSRQSQSVDHFAPVRRKKRYRFELEGEGALSGECQVSFQIPVEAVGAGSQGYSLQQQWLDEQGRLVDSKELIAGRSYQYRLLVSSASGPGPLRLMIPLRASAGVEIDSVVTLSGDRMRGGSRNLQGDNLLTMKKEVLDEGILLSYHRFARQFDEILVNFRPVFAGVYPLAPAQARHLYDSRLFAGTGGDLMVVNPE